LVAESGDSDEAAGCSGWKMRQRTRLAVQQQQRFEADSNADYLKPKVPRHRCIHSPHYANTD
jgi:hypothetical protein